MAKTNLNVTSKTTKARKTPTKAAVGPRPAKIAKATAKPATAEFKVTDPIGHDTAVTYANLHLTPVTPGAQVESYRDGFEGWAIVLEVNKLGAMIRLDEKNRRGETDALVEWENLRVIGCAPPPGNPTVPSHAGVASKTIERVGTLRDRLVAHVNELHSLAQRIKADLDAPDFEGIAHENEDDIQAMWQDFSDINSALESLLFTQTTANFLAVLTEPNYSDILSPPTRPNGVPTWTPPGKAGAA